MLSRLLSLLCYAAVAAFLMAFVFANRQPVELALFPSDYVLSVPLYLALAALFALGLMIGLLYSASIALSAARKTRRDARLIAQLESELAAKSDAKQLSAL
jgi:uncharacterized integral membrane protein